jgi:hypothetical protein
MFLTTPRSHASHQADQNLQQGNIASASTLSQDRTDMVRDAKAAARIKFLSPHQVGFGVGQPSSFVWGFQANSRKNSGGATLNPHNTVNTVVDP